MSSHLKAALKILSAGIVGSLYAGVTALTLSDAFTCAVAFAFGAFLVYFEHKEHSNLRLVDKVLLIAFAVGVIALLCCSAHMSALVPFMRAFAGSFWGIVIVETLLSLIIPLITSPRPVEGLIAMEAATPVRSCYNYYKFCLLCFGGAAFHLMLACRLLANTNGMDGGELLFSSALLTLLGLAGLVLGYFQGRR